MKPSASKISLVLACVVLALPVRAERADRTKPMNIESDTLRYDDVKQTSVFTGRVVVTKGTMVIRGAQLDVRQDPAGNQYGVMKAEPGNRTLAGENFSSTDQDVKFGSLNINLEAINVQAAFGDNGGF